MLQTTAWARIPPRPAIASGPFARTPPIRTARNAASALPFATLANGVRLLAIHAPQLHTASVSVFVRSGSAHEAARDNGISHVIEHMAFKGTPTRDARRINLDAERLGADVNAHTDKDHTAYHMYGMPHDTATMIGMLGDIVRHATYPEAELDRERAVILAELADDQDDPVSIAYRLFDEASFGRHPVARPVIGTARTIARFTRADLVAHVARQYSGSNVVAAVIGDIDVAAATAAMAAAFETMPRGEPNTIAIPEFTGGLRARRVVGSSQTHLVVGFPIPSLRADDPVARVAAAVLGEGMSSPLLHRLRERMGLVYHADCSADVMDSWGQFMIEASTSPANVDALLVELANLLDAHATRIDAAELRRARNQVQVARLRTLERGGRRLEDAALDLFALGRTRSHEEWLDRIASVTAAKVRRLFERMLSAGPAVALAGNVRTGMRDQAAAVLRVRTA
jgi:predicted Zn-dependent peptidase